MPFVSIPLRPILSQKAVTGGLFACLLLLVGCSAPSGTDPDDEGRAAGWHEETLRHDGGERRFRYYVPDTASAAVPVVMLLHGGSQSMDALFADDAGGTQEWREIAEEEGVLLLVPNGTNRDTGAPTGDNQTWNDCRPPESEGDAEADDVGFLTALLDWAIDRFEDGSLSIDRERVFVTGASNGGMMTYRMATERPDRVAAAAAFIANRPKPNQCAPATEPVPLLIVNGTEDPLMPYEGGRIRFGYGTVQSAEATRRYWVTVNRADTTDVDVQQLPNRSTEDGSVVVCETYPPRSRAGARVRFCRVDGGGHAMPSIDHQLAGARRQNHDVEGARLAWSFFAREE